jgi:hypothetical protein
VFRSDPRRSEYRHGGVRAVADNYRLESRNLRARDTGIVLGPADNTLPNYELCAGQRAGDRFRVRSTPRHRQGPRGGSRAVLTTCDSPRVDGDGAYCHRFAALAIDARRDVEWSWWRTGACLYVLFEKEPNFGGPVSADAVSTLSGGFLEAGL